MSHIIIPFTAFSFCCVLTLAFWGPQSKVCLKSRVKCPNASSLQSFWDFETYVKHGNAIRNHQSGLDFSRNPPGNILNLSFSIHIPSKLQIGNEIVRGVKRCQSSFKQIVPTYFTAKANNFEHKRLVSSSVTIYCPGRGWGGGGVVLL